MTSKPSCFWKNGRFRCKYCKEKVNEEPEQKTEETS